MCWKRWSWAGSPNNVKTYPNVVVKSSGKTLASISSIPSVFTWKYTGTNVVADVSYDLFTSSTSGGANEYEIMIWLAAIGGAGPISSSYGSDGKPKAVATVTLAGTSWKLYKGPNGSTTVFSFVASSQVASFNGDVKTFLTYLTSNQGLPSKQYLTSIGAGYVFESLVVVVIMLTFDVQHRAFHGQQRQVHCFCLQPVSQMMVSELLLEGKCGHSGYIDLGSQKRFDSSTFSATTYSCCNVSVQCGGVARYQYCGVWRHLVSPALYNEIAWVRNHMRRGVCQWKLYIAIAHIQATRTQSAYARASS